MAADLSVRSEGLSFNDIYDCARFTIITVRACTRTCNLLHNFQEASSNFEFNLLGQTTCCEQEMTGHGGHSHRQFRRNCHAFNRYRQFNVSFMKF